MMCIECGAKMTTKRENFKYDASGLPGVTLVNVKVSRCRGCGEYEVALPRIEQLHKQMAYAVVAKRARLSALEISFLRRYLNWSGADFAAHLGTTQKQRRGGRMDEHQWGFRRTASCARWLCTAHRSNTSSSRCSKRWRAMPRARCERGSSLIGQDGKRLHRTLLLSGSYRERLGTRGLGVGSTNLDAGEALRLPPASCLLPPVS